MFYGSVKRNLRAGYNSISYCMSHKSHPPPLSWVTGGPTIKMKHVVRTTLPVVIPCNNQNYALRLVPIGVATDRPLASSSWSVPSGGGDVVPRVACSDTDRPGLSVPPILGSARSVPTATRSGSLQ
jgi:hypothetical protein